MCWEDIMRPSGIAILFAAVAALALHVGTPASAQTAALTGTVTSVEGPMEGVVVSAKKDGGTITISVVSDAQGRYSFPASKLTAGKHAVTIRANGFELAAPVAAEIAADKPASADLKLRPTKNLSKQMLNAEWMASIPGTDEQKNSLLNCVSCHTVERIMKSTYDADQFVQVIQRMMGYAQVSTPLKPQRRMESSRADNPERFRAQAEYLASINLSQSDKWEFPLKTLPRVTGRGTHVVITEYDLPRPTIEPHDVALDKDGNVWYTNFGELFFGKLDPNTGKHTEYAVPELKKGWPVGLLDLEFDKDGNVWSGMMYQAGIAKLDPKAEKVQVFPVPPELNNDMSQINMLTMRFDIDGKMWMNDAGPSTILRFDLASGKFDLYDPLTSLPAGKAGHSIYDIKADSKNNLYVTEFLKNNLLRIDAATQKVSVYQTPTPVSRNRRGRMDAQDRFWFAEYRGNKIAMFDTKEEGFKEYALPTQFSSPYDVIWDKNGELWTGGMTTDRVVRLDPKTGQVVEYPLPRNTNMRRMFVDNSTTPVSFWVGSNHGASIVKVEPLD
jgi:virginiamycin B lyase